ncbi:hypothetical protein SAMN04487976_114134 [Xaviernesmea oryzae]|nr:hypothetical protein SAMN04487976_114134 [Xaviernesmea oryzae]
MRMWLRHAVNARRAGRTLHSLATDWRNKPPKLGAGPLHFSRIAAEPRT